MSLILLIIRYVSIKMQVWTSADLASTVSRKNPDLRGTLPVYLGLGFILGNYILEIPSPCAEFLPDCFIKVICCYSTIYLFCLWIKYAVLIGTLEELVGSLGWQFDSISHVSMMELCQEPLLASGQSQNT